MGIAETKSDRCQEALAIDDAALLIGPKNAEFYARRGDTLLLTCDLAAAIAGLDATLDMVSDSSLEPVSQELLHSFPTETPSMHVYRLKLHVNAMRNHVETQLTGDLLEQIWLTIE